MDFIRVDQDKCIKCGLCAEVCVEGIIGMNASGPCVSGNKDLCFACGHCVAICPKKALDHVKTPLAGQTPLSTKDSLSAADVSGYLRSRRSIRAYKDKPVPRETMREILDMARFAPTGANTQGISYLVVDDREMLDRMVLAMIEWAEAEIRNGSPYAPFFEGLTSRYRATGRDTMLWGAPSLIIALEDTTRHLPSARENAIFSLMYAHMYAPSLGLGSCWAGAFEYAAKSGYQPLCEIFQLPENTAVAGALMLGYPKYKFKRFVEREPLSLSWANERVIA